MDPVVTSLTTSEDALTTLRSALADIGVERSRDHLAWQYLGTPAGSLLVDVVEPDPGSPSTVAALYAVIPVEGRHGAQPVMLAQSIDTLTTADHRGRGYFTLLAQRTYDRARDLGVDVVYGMPNGNSVHGFVKYLDWTLLDPIQRLVRPLRWGVLARALGRSATGGPGGRIPVGAVRVPSGARLESVARFDQRHTDAGDLLMSAGGVLGARRSAEYLNWRFVDKPGVHYERWHVTRGSTCLGYVVWRIDSAARIGYVMELLTARHDPPVTRVLMRTALRGMQDEGCTYALSWTLDTMPVSRSYRRAGFVRLPARLEADDLHFGAVALNPEYATVAGTRSSWYISLADSDTH